MQRNIIFVATNDPGFEKVVMDSIMHTRHGMRHTGCAREVWRLLTIDNAADIALAVIDLDFDKRGAMLLHTLCNSGLAFPVLAVATDPGALPGCNHSCSRTTCCLRKPVDEVNLRIKILELCGDGRVEHGGSLPPAVTPDDARLQASAR